MTGEASGGKAGLLKRLAVGIGLAKPPKKAKAGLPGGAETKISQTLDQALAKLAGDSAKRILVSGDRIFFDAVTAQGGGLATVWTSCLVEDVQHGAANPDQVDFGAFDAVLCGGSQAALSFRHAVSRMAEVDPTRPVHWVGTDWEFCGGTLPVPSEAEDAEALLFNHFQHYFGIKDPLLYRIEIYHGAERKHFTRILLPNESIVLRLSDHFPMRDKAACFAVFVAHPILTRGRHYRLRTCADIFWRDSFTTLHSAHEFGRSPNHKFEFRAAKDLVRAGEVVLTIPNYAHDLGEARAVTVVDGSGTREIARDPQRYLDEVKLARNGGAGDFFGWKYRGYGGSFWFSLEGQQACRNGHRGSLSANHHVSVPIEDQAHFAATPEELENFAALRQAGFMVEPYPVPIVPESDALQFGLEFDSANPRFNQFRIFLFSGDGRFLDEIPYKKMEPGPFWPGAIVRQWDDPRRDTVRLAVVQPDWQAIKFRRKGLKLMADLVVENRHTGDRDVTEFQNCWRNTGVMVPGMASFAGPGSVVFGRSNLFARVRTGRGFRTALLAVNGSGKIDYRRKAEVDVTVVNSKGVARTGSFTLPPFGWKLVWIDELLADLDAHLGGAEVGTLLVGAPTADLNCQVVTTSAQGAVSLQHMWGY
jgi:hypothetical protein